ncbi:YlcI/YnfO family protein [Rhizobium mongolense]|uniref:Uncharacterized protein n=1 Tax=Rhizobium mongolense TaxID=57676 RepID=A0A7W6RL40_9HYPH|nr:hypothetical protein [Rhizobium mongolense]
MKTASLPSLRFDPELRAAAESVLEVEETLSAFLEKSRAGARSTFGRRRWKLSLAVSLHETKLDGPDPIILPRRCSE